MKIIFASVLLFLALQASALGSFETDIPEANRVILTTGAWTPSVEETSKALMAIQSFLEQPTSGGNQRSKYEIKMILKNAKSYRVQFVGQLRQKRRVILCNFFRAPLTGEKDGHPDWKHKPVSLNCDGGYWYWKIDYDPGTEKCLNFLPNAYA
jgi:hypothetical protein